MISYIEVDADVPHVSKTLRISLKAFPHVSEKHSNTFFLSSVLRLQILYPIALTAAIFSMQPRAIPFDLTPKSFPLAVIIQIAVMYAIQFIDRYAQPRWPSLQYGSHCCFYWQAQRYQLINARILYIGWEHIGFV